MKDAKVELVEQLLARVQLSRRKGPPEVAGFAAELEIEFQAKLQYLQKQATEQSQQEPEHANAA